MQFILTGYLSRIILRVGKPSGIVASIRPELIAMSAGIHVWTVGAIGVVTLAVTTRASLGQTGCDLVPRGVPKSYASW
jgi:uncharacterized protein involved in response to NO